MRDRHFVGRRMDMVRTVGQCPRRTACLADQRRSTGVDVRCVSTFRMVDPYVRATGQPGSPICAGARIYSPGHGGCAQRVRARPGRRCDGRAAQSIDRLSTTARLALPRHDDGRLHSLSDGMAFFKRCMGSRFVRQPRQTLAQHMAPVCDVQHVFGCPDCPLPRQSSLAAGHPVFGGRCGTFGRNELDWPLCPSSSCATLRYRNQTHLPGGSTCPSHLSWVTYFN